MTENQPPLRIVIAGHVDHGKSTLIGRLLYDTSSLPVGKKEELDALSRKRGAAAIEWSYLLDAFQAERDQNITIDTTEIRFRTAARSYAIIDAPGHREFLRNMISGAAAADAAVLVVDAAEGLQEQTRRHAYLLHLLGLRQIAVAVNKMDSIGFDRERFMAVAGDIEAYLASLQMKAACIVPLSARCGDMVARRGDSLGWYEGPMLVEALDNFSSPLPPVEQPLRFPVQDVYKRGDKRILVGRVESGIVRRGDEVLLSPGNERTSVASIEVWPEDAAKIQASAGECIGITLSDQLFVERGHMISSVQQPPMLSNVFRARIFWLGKNALAAGDSYRIRIATQDAAFTVDAVERVIDTQDLRSDTAAATVLRNQVADIVLRRRDPVPVDPYDGRTHGGRLVIYDGADIAGGGIISMDGYPDQRRAVLPGQPNLHAVSHLMTAGERARRYGHRGGVFWLTGLSGAGKSTLAMAVEKILFERGYLTYVLDGDNVRRGLNADLGFSPADRVENIRRVGEVAALMAEAGLIVITAFISPYRADRLRARAASQGLFHEIYVQADLATCEGRDPKGLYKKARAGEILDFTGVSYPYEQPEQPDLAVDTQHRNVEGCVEEIVRYIDRHVKSLSS